MWETWIETVNAFWTAHPQEVRALSLVGAAIALGLAFYYAIELSKKLMGKIRMKKREQLAQDVREIIEEHFVCALNEAISSNRISIDEARQLYAKFARLGFWGLHPRKFEPRKTGLDLQELKERLKAKRTTTNTTSTSSAVNKMLDGLATELG